MSNDRPAILAMRLAARARGEISEVDDLPNQFPLWILYRALLSRSFRHRKRTRERER